MTKASLKRIKEVNEDTINDIVNRIVKVVNPEKINRLKSF